MTSNSQVKAVRSTTRDHSLWQWPIDLIRYDRTPELSAIEHEALIALGWDLRRGRCHDPSRPEWATIKRLLDPLDDACHSLFIPDNRYHRRCALDAIALILHGSRRTRLTFWAWSPATWVEVLGADQRSLQQAFSGWLDGAVRPYLIGLAYLLGGFSAFGLLGTFNRIAVATRIFGPSLVKQAVDQVMAVLRDWGYHSAHSRETFPGLVCLLLLLNRSPYLSDLTTEAVEQYRRHEAISLQKRSGLYGVQRALAALGHVAPPTRSNGSQKQIIEGVDALWQDWVEHWTITSTLTHKVRLTFRTILLKVGRWLAQKHPDVREPAQWTRELCATYIAEVERMCVGDYARASCPTGHAHRTPTLGQDKGRLYRGSTRLLP